MTARQILPPDAPRAAWLAARRDGVGASDVSAILGLSTYRCARDVYWDKVEGEQVEQTEEMLWGQLQEPIVREQFTVRTGVGVRWPIGLHSDGIMLCTPDGLTSDGGLYEGKCARRPEDWANDQLTDHAELQVQHGMAVMGLRHAWVAALLYGARMVYRRVTRDEKLIQMLIKAEQEFWYDHVLPKIPPPLDGSEAAENAIKKRFPYAVDKAIELDPAEAVELVSSYRAAKANQTADEEAFRLAQNRMRDVLGDATEAQVNGRTMFTWKQNGSSFDEARFRADHPELAEQHTITIACPHCEKPIPTERLNLAAIKAGEPEIYAQYRNRVLRVSGPKK